MEFNEHLKHIRAVSKTTQQELADYLNISVQSVSKWEKGAALPSVEFLPKIAEFYNCSVNAFFSEYELQIYEQFEPIDDSQRIKLMEAMLKSAGLSRGSSAKEDIDNLETEETLPIEVMFLPAVYEYLKENDKLSMAGLQRALSIGYSLVGRIADALEKMGIVIMSKEGHVIVKEKIDLLLPHIDKKVVPYLGKIKA